MTLDSLIVILAILALTHSAKVFDIATNFKSFQCMKDLGYSHSIIRAYHSYGAIDIVASDTIPISNQLGFSTDVYMFPCRGKNATLQVF